MMVTAPTFHRSGKAWRDFRFEGLEKVSRAQTLLFPRLEWLLPGLDTPGKVTADLRARLKQLFDEEVQLSLDSVHVVSTRSLRKYLVDPTMISVLAPFPHKSRALLEVGLGLAHAAIDVLLGGAGETVALRPLTEIEEGVMGYVLLEGLKSLAPHLTQGLPRLKLEGICRGADDALALLAAESQVAVVELQCTLGAHSGHLRLFVPASVLASVQPVLEGAARRAERVKRLSSHLSRLSSVRTAMRVEIGRAEISSTDLASLRDRDVLLVEQLWARPDRGEGGTAQLRLGLGRFGHVAAALVLDGGSYKAKITGFSLDEGAWHDQGPFQTGVPQAGGAAVSEAVEAANAGPGSSPGEREHVEESSTTRKEGTELLNDIPLQIAVELARLSVTAEEVANLKVGQVLELNRVPGEPVELSVHGKVVARGELVEVEGHLGVRVTTLAD